MTRSVLVTVGVLLMVLSGWGVYSSFQSTPSVVTPPSSGNRSFSPDVPAKGPTKVTIGDQTVDENTMKPSMLFVPSLKIYASIDETGSLGKVVEGELQLPEPSKVTRWRPGAPVVASKGSTMLAGHVNEGSVQGALFDLANIEPGSIAYVSDSKGRVRAFKLVAVENVPKSKTASVDKLWSKKGPRRLYVITCTGELHVTANGSRSFGSNLVTEWVPYV